MFQEKIPFNERKELRKHLFSYAENEQCPCKRKNRIQLFYGPSNELWKDEWVEEKEESETKLCECIYKHRST